MTASAVTVDSSTSWCSTSGLAIHLAPIVPLLRRHPRPHKAPVLCPVAYWLPLWDCSPIRVPQAASLSTRMTLFSRLKKVRHQPIEAKARCTRLYRRPTAGRRRTTRVVTERMISPPTHRRPASPTRTPSRPCHSAMSHLHSCSSP